MGTISIIIPTRNRIELLKATLENILSQTQVPDEIIIVDDHSGDGTVEYLKSLKLRNVKVFCNEGKGPGAARNTGLKLAHGNYIKFFDSDDIMSLNSIEAQLSTLEESGEDMVYSPYVHASYHNNEWIQKDVVLQYSPIPKKMTLRDCMAYGFFAVIPAMMFRRSFLDKVGAWREDILAYEDWDYFWRLSKFISTPVHTNECLMIYRIHGSQTTDKHSSDTKRDQEKLVVLQDILLDGIDAIPKRVLIECELQKTKYLVNGEHAIPFKFKAGLVWKRFRNKIERLRTKTNWERMHGPSKAAKISDWF